MKSLRIFVDANVLFSACNQGSRVNAMLREAIDQHEVVTSETAMAETARNLAKKKPAWLVHWSIFQSKLHSVPEATAPPELDLPAVDGILLGTAIATDCDIFITGDHHHFGKLFGKTIGGVRVLTPAAFTAEYAN
jgi:predicted nucleic acid-binding protein